MNNANQAKVPHFLLTVHQAKNTYFSELEQALKAIVAREAEILEKKKFKETLEVLYGVRKLLPDENSLIDIKKKTQELIYRYAEFERARYKKEVEEPSQIAYLARVFETPWPQLELKKISTELLIDRLKAEMNKKGSIAVRLGPAYEKLIQCFDKISSSINDFEQRDPWRYYSGYSKSELREMGELDDAVKDTIHLLFTKTLSLKAYEAKAKLVYAKASPALQCLGGLMMALAVAAVTLGALFALAPVVVTTGVLLGGVGAGFFYHGRHKGLSKAMSNVAKGLIPEHEASPVHA